MSTIIYDRRYNMLEINPTNNLQLEYIDKTTNEVLYKYPTLEDIKSDFSILENNKFDIYKNLDHYKNITSYSNKKVNGFSFNIDYYSLKFLELDFNDIEWYKTFCDQLRIDKLILFERDVWICKAINTFSSNYSDEKLFYNCYYFFIGKPFKFLSTKDSLIGLDIKNDFCISFDKVKKKNKVYEIESLIDPRLNCYRYNTNNLIYAFESELCINNSDKEIISKFLKKNFLKIDNLEAINLDELYQDYLKFKN